jgi:hypothetical protein
MMLKMLRKVAPWFLAIILLAALCACRSEPVAPGEAQVIILDPVADATLNTNSVTISVHIDNFKLVDKNGQPAQPGEGHLLYYSDVTPPLVKGQSALTAEGSYVISTQKTCEWKNLTTGRHNFWVQLVNNDNTPLIPPAAVRLPLTVVMP